jgi:hypothetical protein
MGKFTVIPQNTFDALQMDAGVLLKTFDPSNPVAPRDEDIICATTGGINPSCVPTYSDFGEDVDNVPLNMMEFKHLDGWECKLSTTGLGTSPELIKLALGVADIVNANKVVPRKTIKLADYTDLWWVGDKANGGCIAIQLKNALSTGGFSLQSTKNGKGTVSLEITGHVSINAQQDVPMVFYSIDDSFSNVTLNPESQLVTLFEVPVSDMQTDLAVTGDKITGTLKFLDGSNPITDNWGEGNFMALKFSDLDPDATSVKVGLDPSQSSGLVEIINDPDKNGVFKVTDKDRQVFVIISSDGTNSHRQEYDLSGLTIETE